MFLAYLLLFAVALCFRFMVDVAYLDWHKNDSPDTKLSNVFCQVLRVLFSEALPSSIWHRVGMHALGTRWCNDGLHEQ